MIELNLDHTRLKIEDKDILKMWSACSMRQNKTKNIQKKRRKKLASYILWRLIKDMSQRYSYDETRIVIIPKRDFIDN